MAKTAGPNIVLDNGTSWPNPDKLYGVEWTLRYGTPSKEELLIAASTLVAYRALVNSNAAAREEYVREMRSALPDTELRDARDAR